ncbi:hypothetical protein QQY24_14910 [Streptomyces sp. TG1A-8]|uniref:hypothetical protein n=1 Tax=Streptomyces sp. TG1A-8 TaxID=3051385 RepID=UPI00265B7DD9|nr:hypothetical protein [Streptomyces sp. TG1A-8]MDO0926640.1 hypothetical protein [Streptomyces sp. TG1A-8]
MTSAPSSGSPDRQGAVLACEVEGFLLLQAEREQARREAENLCAKLPWLTTAQAEDLARHYTEQRLGLTRQALQSFADRAARLRGEYEARYATLRRRLLKYHALSASVVLAATASAAAAVSLLARGGP